VISARDSGLEIEQRYAASRRAHRLYAQHVWERGQPPISMQNAIAVGALHLPGRKAWWRIDGREPGNGNPVGTKP